MKKFIKIMMCSLCLTLCTSCSLAFGIFLVQAPGQLELPNTNRERGDSLENTDNTGSTEEELQ